MLFIAHESGLLNWLIHQCVLNREASYYFLKVSGEYPYRKGRPIHTVVDVSVVSFQVGVR